MRYNKTKGLTGRIALNWGWANDIRIRVCDSDKWDMKCRYWNKDRFVPVSWCLNLESRAELVVQGVLVSVAERWSSVSNRGRFLSVPVQWLWGGCHPKVNQSLLVWPAALRLQPLDPNWFCLVFASAGVQQVTLNTKHMTVLTVWQHLGRPDKQTADQPVSVGRSTVLAVAPVHSYCKQVDYK